MAVREDGPPPGEGITALLGPTNTGKTHRAIERMLEHESGMIGLPLRLLAREVYDRVSAKIGERAVALVTGEEKRVPPRPRYWVCTVESMPVDHEVDFVAIDEIQLAAHRQRGHTFTDRLLRLRGRRETWLLGSDTMRPLVEELLPTARIQKHPRYSQLRYTGVHSIGALPPRTAVVAFSADEVYAIAEQLRRRHGGTAVVLGALSPRTRNAQVAMYQAGEVQHMVATDAIGMGLNMDVDRVVFASLRKFDGREARGLELSEMGQIAGRAGRYTTDGGFGVLRPQSGLPPRVVQAIETHHFVPVRRLVWRSADLDFSTVESLIGSLRARPKRSALRLVEQADDFESLLKLAARPEVRRLANTPDAVALLWDVCRIPDFRKLLLESHVELLAAIFEQLAADPHRIDEDWMASRIRRLDDDSGDIETLMRRIAFIRTWTYISNHTAWIADASHWQERTREIEDRCSDALHERLTARFVEGHADDYEQQPRTAKRRPVRVVDRRPIVEGSPFATLAGLSAELPDAPGAHPTPQEHDRVAWVQSIVEAPFTAFTLAQNGKIAFEGQTLARLQRGADLLHPEVVVTVDDVGAGARSRILRRMQAWIRDVVADLVLPEQAVPEGLSSHARGLVYQLEQGLGIVLVARAREQLQRIDAAERARLEACGIVIGRFVVFVPSRFGGRRTPWRAALWRTWVDPPIVPVAPTGASVSIEAPAEVDPDFYLRIGYPVVAGRAVRADQLERTATHLLTMGREPFALPSQIFAWLGVRRRRAEPIVRALGFSSGPAGWTPRSSRQRGRRGNRARVSRG